jgi:predicted DNA-binding protein (MmcQ/YjbR family)
MDIESARDYCLSLPSATEKVQWDNDLLFLIGGKMFTVVALDAASTNRIAFKCTPEKFDELIELDHIVPAPYMARNKWVSLQQFDALSESEIKALIKASYEMVLQKLPKKVQAEIRQR